jgi:cytochrome c peroxidase
VIGGIVYKSFLALSLVAVLLAADDYESPARFFSDPSGQFSTISPGARLDLTGPFFQSLGTNGRSCATCHVATDAWSITPEHIKARFYAMGGQDPLFRTNDGSTCADADVSTTEKAESAYRLLLNKGLIRVQLPIPQNAEFSVAAVDDPYYCAPIPGNLSVYRRVLPGTNLRFLSTVMWDGRESASGNTLEQNLRSQAIDATLGHAQGAAAPSDDQLDSIVQFELSTYTAQTFSHAAGKLDEDGGRGGPFPLSKQNFFIGINDPLGNNPRNVPFDPSVFRIYRHYDKSENGPKKEARESIRRGETIFNTRAFLINGVAGLPVQSLMGTCTVCHDSPNVGDHSVAAPLNIGVADASQRTPDLPLYSLYCAATGQTIETTDPGRALITGKCADIGKFKGPILRALGARAPYFHNGSAAALKDVVEFYDTRFHINFTHEEKQDLIAFLKSL